MAESLQESAKRIRFLIHGLIQEFPSLMKFREQGLWEALADEAKIHPSIIENVFAGIEVKFAETLDRERILEKSCNCAYQLEENSYEDAEDWEI